MASVLKTKKYLFSKITTDSNHTDIKNEADKRIVTINKIYDKIAFEAFFYINDKNKLLVFFKLENKLFFFLGFLEYGLENKKKEKKDMGKLFSLKFTYF